MPGSSPGMTNNGDYPIRAPSTGDPESAETDVAQRLARPGERLQLDDDGAAAAVSRGAGRLSVLLWHPVEPAGSAGGAPRHFCRAEEFRDRFQRPDLLEGDRQHLSLYRRGDIAEDGGRACAGLGDEPAISAEKSGSRIAAV